MTCRATLTDMRSKTTGSGRCALARTLPPDRAIGCIFPLAEATRRMAFSASSRLRTLALRRPTATIVRLRIADTTWKRLQSYSAWLHPDLHTTFDLQLRAALEVRICCG